MTLSLADFDDPQAHYAYQCATCAARYIVNVQPTNGNGGIDLAAPWRRPMPGGADEAKAMALHCCHDNPEPASGIAVRWAPSHVVGSPTHLWLGDAEYAAAGFGDPGAVDETVEEHRQIETVFVKESEIWQPAPENVLLARMRPVGSWPNLLRVSRFRLDVILDETAEGRRRDWASLLAYTRVSAKVGERNVTGFRHDEEGLFFRPRRCHDCEHSGFLDRIKREHHRTLPEPVEPETSLQSRDDDTLMLHASCLDFEGEIFEVPPRAHLTLTLEYRGPPISIGFLRIVTEARELLPII